MFSQYEAGVLFWVYVKTGSRKQKIEVSKKHGVVVSVTAQPVRGQATRELVSVLEKKLGVCVTVHKVEKNHKKIMYATGITPDEAAKLLEV